MFQNDQYCQNKIKKLENEWFASFALQSLTLCKYNLCSLHFPVCHISWDSKKWKMDQNMKNKHGWIACTKVSGPPPPQIVFLKMYPLPEKLLSFSSVQGKTLNLPPFCPLLFLWIRKNIFAIFFFNLEGMQIWSQDDQKFSLCIVFKLYLTQRKVPPPPKKSLHKFNVRKIPCPFLCLGRKNLLCHRFPFISSLKPSSLILYLPKKHSFPSSRLYH